jgi:hypothetical protein
MSPYRTSEPITLDFGKIPDFIWLSNGSGIRTSYILAVSLDGDSSAIICRDRSEFKATADECRYVASLLGCSVISTYHEYRQG